MRGLFHFLLVKYQAGSTRDRVRVFVACWGVVKVCSQECRGTTAVENVLLASVVSQLLLLSVPFASSSASPDFICSLWLLPLPLS